MSNNDWSIYDETKCGDNRRSGDTVSRHTPAQKKKGRIFTDGSKFIHYVILMQLKVAVLVGRQK